MRHYDRFLQPLNVQFSRWVNLLFPILTQNISGQNVCRFLRKKKQDLLLPRPDQTLATAIASRGARHYPPPRGNYTAARRALVTPMAFREWKFPLCAALGGPAAPACGGLRALQLEPPLAARASTY